MTAVESSQSSEFRMHVYAHMHAQAHFLSGLSCIMLSMNN